jgi:hypothetical protein
MLLLFRGLVGGDFREELFYAVRQLSRGSSARKDNSDAPSSQGTPLKRDCLEFSSPVKTRFHLKVDVFSLYFFCDPRAQGL